MSLENKSIEMQDDNLEAVIGGAARKTSARASSREYKDYCEYCKKETTFITYSGGRGVCQICKNEKGII